MAKISLSEEAPTEEPITFLLANAEVRLGEDETVHETDDVTVIANAEAHPWLTVEFPDPTPEEPQPDPVFDSTPPEEKDPADEPPAAFTAGLDHYSELDTPDQESAE